MASERMTVTRPDALASELSEGWSGGKSETRHLGQRGSNGNVYRGGAFPPIHPLGALLLLVPRKSMPNQAGILP